MSRYGRGFPAKSYYQQGEPAAAPASVTGAAALTGAGSLTVSSSTLTQFGAAALMGTGTLSATGTRTLFGVAALTGAGTLAGTGNRAAFGAAALVGNGTLTSDGTRVRFEAAALTGTGVLDVTSSTRTVFGVVAPATGVVDDFDRADGALGSGWTRCTFVSADADIESSRARVSPAGVETSQFWNATQYGPDQDVQVAVYGWEPGASLYLLLNVDNTLDNCYLASLDDAGSSTFGVTFYRRTSGGWATVGDLGIAFPYPSDGDTFAFRHDGSSLELIQNGVRLGIVTDGSPLTNPGGIGFGGRTASALRLDDFGPRIPSGQGTLSVLVGERGAADLTGEGTLSASGEVETGAVRPPGHGNLIYTSARRRRRTIVASATLEGGGELRAIGVCETAGVVRTSTPAGVVTATGFRTVSSGVISYALGVLRPVGVRTVAVGGTLTVRASATAQGVLGTGGAVHLIATGALVASGRTRAADAPPPLVETGAADAIGFGFLTATGIVGKTTQPLDADQQELELLLLLI